MSMPVALALLALFQSAPIQVPQGEDLTEAISSSDAAFFALFFEGCDPAALATMVTDDFEFFDDRGGRVVTDGASFVAMYRTQCETRLAPDSWRSRREVVLETLGIYPINSYGAVETGEHFFYERQGNGPETRVGRALFSQMWKLEDGHWKLARVFSYDHGPAE